MHTKPVSYDGDLRATFTYLKNVFQTSDGTPVAEKM